MSRYLYSYGPSRRPVVNVQIIHPVNHDASLTELALIDSGASRTAVSMRLLVEIGAMPLRTHRVTGFNGIQSEVFLCRASIKISDFIFRDMFVWGVEEKGRAVTTLIGRDILNQMLVIMDGRNGMLHLIKT